MKNRLFVWSCIVMTFFSACQQAENEKNEVDELRMSIAASIKGQTEMSDSRYSGTDPTTVDFDESDEIGVFVDGGSAIKWTYSTSGWGADEIIYWPDKTGTHTFYAFYPYSAATSYASVPMPSLLNQTGTLAGISECDFLVTSVSQTYGTDGVVRFQDDNAFRHVSSLLQLTINGKGDLSSSTLKKITITGTNIVAPTTYSFEDGAVSLVPDDASDELSLSMELELLNADKTFYFIVNEKKDASAVVKLSIEYETDGKMYVAEMEGFANNVFGGGLRQSYTITIKDSSLIISGASISSWGEGESLDDVVINGESQES